MNYGVLDRVVSSLPGWCTQVKARHLADLILAERPRICVEIGVFGGRSLIATALALQETGQGVVYGIDPWTTDAALEAEADAGNREWWGRVDLAVVYRTCCEAVTRAGLWPWVRLLCGPSHAVAGVFCAPFGAGIDVLHVDGNHSSLASCRDVCLYLPLVRPGGWVWLDDTDWSAVQPAVALVGSQCDLIADHGRYRLYRRRP